MSTFKIKIPITVFKKTNQWIAYCPVLKTFGYSDVSDKEALTDFDTAIKTFFHIQEKRGKLKETLLSLGWHHYNTQTNPFGVPEFPNFAPEKRYRAQQAESFLREIEVPAA